MSSFRRTLLIFYVFMYFCCKLRAWWKIGFTRWFTLVYKELTYLLTYLLTYNIKVSSIKRSENFHNKDGRPDGRVSNYK